MMMRHISMYRVKPQYRTPEVLQKLKALLEALPQQVPTITHCEIGLKPMEIPTASPDGLVKFYDIVQIITFATPQDCMAYPTTPGHDAFLAASHEYIDEAVGIDYPVP